MTAKRMVAVRLPDPLVDRIDALAAVEGVTRTEWCSQALARQAVRASGAREAVIASRTTARLYRLAHPHAGDGAVDDGTHG